MENRASQRARSSDPPMPETRIVLSWRAKSAAVNRMTPAATTSGPRPRLIVT